MKRALIPLLLVFSAVAAFGQTRVSSFANSIPGGSVELLQVTGAVAGDTPGGPATSATRTLFYWTPDLTRTPPITPAYSGPNWPYVLVDRILTIDPALNARLFGTIPVTGAGGAVIGQALTVNGAPVYQRTAHTTAGDISGLGANWQVITTDGRGHVQLPARAQTRISTFVANTAEGSLEVLQVTGAVAGATAGGPATAETRTLFYWTPDLARTPPVSPGYTGPNWPLVLVDASYTLAPSLRPQLFGTVPVLGAAGNVVGQALTVNGYPVYQRTAHTGAGEIAGIGANWQMVGTDGRGYTQMPSRAMAVVGMVNASSRARVAAGENAAIAGFVIAGGETRQVLVRAVGPTLGAGPFNVAGVLATPRIELYRGQTRIGGNAGVGANRTAIDAAGQRSGAFALGSSGADAALLADLGPGAYTAIVSSTTGAAGVALVEVYDLSGAAPGQKLLNIATRAAVGAGENTLIAGFVVPPGSAKTVLVRGIGPGLAPFGVAGALAQPALQLLSGSTVVAQNTNWATAVDREAIAIAGVRVGAFGLANNDCALIATLAPGAYTATVTGVGGAMGVALVEVYELQ